MKAVVTRVNSASVSIDGEVHGKIGRGFLILLGVAPEDTPEKCKKLADFTIMSYHGINRLFLFA